MRFAPTSTGELIPDFWLPLTVSLKDGLLHPLKIFANNQNLKTQQFFNPTIWFNSSSLEGIF